MLQEQDQELEKELARVIRRAMKERRREAILKAIAYGIVAIILWEAGQGLVTKLVAATSPPPHQSASRF